ncbi:SAM-dependent methyltransferase [Actinomadura graeca]|uniref:SAM-dependent methyltransferase n=1 Tax=Actinomadura graeca TaxID=2750812 RepID=A0ABX8R6K0_9ACTN|nr:SAM-dependent methyltransferase [Actinomadura graeca]QXJ25884.1 SAM-dependent methyltransferase [Actinomadura graeca]
MSERPIPAVSNVTGASPARVYDYLLGGHHNYLVDRQAAETIMSRDPSIRDGARHNRAFLGRVVMHLARDQGIDQFLDLGSGLPTAANVHQVAQKHNPEARVVYVDNDASVRAHARALLSGDRRTAFACADVRDPGLLETPELQLLDWSRPVAILLIAVLHFLSEADQPADVVAWLTSHTVPGSFVAISHVTDAGATPSVLQAIRDQHTETPVPVYVRAPAAIAALFAGHEPLAPGLVDITRWHAHELAPSYALPALGGVAAVR